MKYTRRRQRMRGGHVHDRLQEHEIPRLKAIHNAKDIESLKKKVHQQHVNSPNCWQDSASAIFFQSDQLSEHMWERVLLPTMRELIEHKEGDIRELYSHDFIVRIATKLQADFELASPPEIFTYIVCRYIRKLFQLYEDKYVPGGLPAPVAAPPAPPPPPPALRMAASRNMIAANALQQRLRPGRRGGLISDITGADKIITKLMHTGVIMSATAYKSYIPLGTAPALSTVYGYYFSVFWPGQLLGHVVSLFKTNGRWYLYDNSNTDLIYEFNDAQSNDITNIGINSIKLRMSLQNLKLSYDITLINTHTSRYAFGKTPLNLLPPPDQFRFAPVVIESLAVSDDYSIMFSTAPAPPVVAPAPPVVAPAPPGAAMNLNGGRRRRKITRKRSIRKRRV